MHHRADREGQHLAHNLHNACDCDCSLPSFALSHTFLYDVVADVKLQNNMNTRANIMYFIEHFLEMSTKERHNDYARMMQRDIIRVVDAVCPEDGSGAANVKVVRKVRAPGSAFFPDGARRSPNYS